MNEVTINLDAFTEDESFGMDGDVQVTLNYDWVEAIKDLEDALQGLDLPVSEVHIDNARCAWPVAPAGSGKGAITKVANSSLIAYFHPGGYFKSLSVAGQDPVSKVIVQSSHLSDSNFRAATEILEAGDEDDDPD